MKTDKISSQSSGRVGYDTLPLLSGEKQTFITNKYFCTVVFAAFVAILAATAFSVPLFGDDYYYACFVKSGADFFISENILHYMETNGRALVHVLDQLLLGFGIWPWRIFVILTASCGALLSASCISGVYGKGRWQNERYRYALLLSCILFSSLSLPVLRQSVWWATGSLNYLFPTVLLILLWCLLEGSYEIGARLRPVRYVLLVTVALLCSMSTEQAAFGALAICVWFTVRPFLEGKRLCIIYPVCTAVAVLGFLTLYLAPGNAVRTSYYPDFYAMDLFEKIVYNARELFTVACGKNGMLNAVLAAFLGFSALKASEAFSKDAASKRAKGLKLLQASATALGAVTFCWSVLILQRLSEGDLTPKYRLFIAVMLLLFFVSLLIVLVDSFFGLIRKQDPTFLFCGGALVLQLAMLISPQFGPRTVFISAILLFIAAFRFLTAAERKFQTAFFALYSLALSTIALTEGSRIQWIILLSAFALCLILHALKKSSAHTVSVLAALAICLCGMVKVYGGYAENYEVHRYNEAAVTEFVSGDMTDDTLYLRALPNHTHKYTMPYDDPYHMYRFKLLYGIPSHVEVVFVE